MHQKKFVCCLLLLQKQGRPRLQLVSVGHCKFQHQVLLVDLLREHLSCFILATPLLWIITVFKPCGDKTSSPHQGKGCNYRSRKHRTLQDGITSLAESWFIFKPVPKETKFPQSCSLSLRLPVLPKELLYKLGSFNHILHGRRGKSYKTPACLVKLAVGRA